MGSSHAVGTQDESDVAGGVVVKFTSRELFWLLCLFYRRSCHINLSVLFIKEFAAGIFSFGIHMCNNNTYNFYSTVQSRSSTCCTNIITELSPAKHLR